MLLLWQEQEIMTFLFKKTTSLMFNFFNLHMKKELIQIFKSFSFVQESNYGDGFHVRRPNVDDY